MGTPRLHRLSPGVDGGLKSKEGFASFRFAFASICLPPLLSIPVHPGTLVVLTSTFRTTASPLGIRAVREEGSDRLVGGSNGRMVRERGVRVSSDRRPPTANVAGSTVRGYLRGVRVSSDRLIGGSNGRMVRERGDRVSSDRLVGRSNRLVVSEKGVRVSPDRQRGGFNGSRTALSPAREPKGALPGQVEPRAIRWRRYRAEGGEEPAEGKTRAIREPCAIRWRRRVRRRRAKREDARHPLAPPLRTESSRAPTVGVVVLAEGEQKEKTRAILEPRANRWRRRAWKENRRRAEGEPPPRAIRWRARRKAEGEPPAILWRSTLRLVIPPLTEDNWTSWKENMRAVLLHRGLWDAVTGEDERPTHGTPSQLRDWNRSNGEAYGELFLHISDLYKHLMKGKETARE
ncbi:MAG: hypothetical protein BJ554DRAFT_5379, partial [Olpidium bornovanus]